MKFFNFLLNSNPLLKFISLLLIIIFSFVFAEIKFVFSLLLITFFTNIIFDKTRKGFLKVFLITLPFIFSFGYINARFITSGEIIFDFLNIKITNEGFKLGFIVSLRMAIAIYFTYLFISTTDPRNFMISLVKYLKIPYKFAFSFFVALRFFKMLRIVQEEAFQAYKQKGIKFYNPKRFFAFIILMIFTIFRRIFSMAISMESRGFGAFKKRTFWRDINFSINDIFFILYFFISFLIVYFLLLNYFIYEYILIFFL